MNKITLKAARVNANLLQTEVAEKLGVTVKTIGNWERGENDIPAKAFLALCELYGVSVDAIILP